MALRSMIKNDWFGSSRLVVTNAKMYGWGLSDDLMEFKYSATLVTAYKNN